MIHTSARKLVRIAIPALGLAFSACTVGPDYQRVTPDRVAPEHFSAETGQTVETFADWWRGFRDPALDELVAIALEHNPDVAAADASIRAARAGLDRIDSARSVQLDAAARIGRDQLSKDSENFANIPFPNAKSGFNDYRGGLDVSWEIDLFGHTARSLESARASLGAQQARRRDVALSISAETARSVLDYRHAQLRLANAVDVVERHRSLLALIRLQRDAGLTTDIDVAQADQALREAQALIEPLRVATGAAVLALVPLTGLPQPQIAARLEHGAATPALPAATRFAMSSTALERRPDVAQAERQLAAATADVGVAVADQYPRFSLLGDAGWDSIQPGQFGQRASRYWNLGPQMTLPVLTGGRLAAQLRQSEAGRDAALAAYRHVVLAALAETESAMLRCRGDQARLTELDEALVRNAQAVSLIDRQLGAGELPQTALLGAQIQRGSLVDQQLDARQTLARDLVLLYKSLGGS